MFLINSFRMNCQDTVLNLTDAEREELLNIITCDINNLDSDDYFLIDPCDIQDMLNEEEER
jgi:hypothetical protein